MTESKFIKSPSSVAVLGVSFSGGQPKGGVDEGPIRMIEHGILDQIKDLGWKVDHDGRLDHYKDLEPAEDPDIGILKRPRYVGAVSKAVSEAVESHARQGQMVLTLGGDHSIGLGTVSGSTAVYGEDTCLIWVDAHADINTPDSTDSGNLHGCPISWMLGIAGKVEGFEWVQPRLKPSNLVYIGLRDVDPAEKRILREHNIKAFSMFEVDKYGIGKVVEMALDHVNPDRTKPIHLSFDVDALDPSVAPATGTPVRGGLTFREGHYICEAIAETKCLVALDVVEVNPLLGSDEASWQQTVKIGCSLVRSALGETLL
ncbi:arginase [Piptocephalis cylindrospora]|uniref:Arginase n=1 Tax=Piptocephalis cylindrospora TaxID=1907219 RepID=A0A4P9YAC5_9FUNG|nr:arginase [Piptocephalis cylindrospora]|eukprot:RKP15431.1 arginase [Piptocephalis cylindrospora]